MHYGLLVNKLKSAQVPINDRQTETEMSQPKVEVRWSSVVKYLGWFVVALAAFTGLEALAYGLANSFMTNYAPFSYLLPHGLALVMFYWFANHRALLAMAFLSSLMAISGTLASDLHGVASAAIAIAALACWLKAR